VSACERVGARRASLGPRILRAETAAIVAVTLLQARFGDLS
jgi:16S rRNA (uracil1498-N3)-methyltransferase